MLTLHFNNTTLDVQESDSSYRYRSLMSKPQLVLKFSLSEFVEIPVGAWCEYQGVKYKLGSPENIKKTEPAISNTRSPSEHWRTT